MEKLIRIPIILILFFYCTNHLFSQSLHKAFRTENGFIKNNSKNIILTKLTDLPIPSIIYPSSGATDIPIIPVFKIGAVNGADRYRIELAFDSYFFNVILYSYITYNSVTNNGDTVLLSPGVNDVNNFKGSTTYYLRVRAELQDGSDSSPWSQTYNYTTQQTGFQLSQPNLNTPYNSSTVDWNNVSFIWEQVNSATSYQIQYSTDANFNGFTFWWTSTNQLLNASLQANQTYFWRVVAYNSNSISQFSPTYTLYTSNTTLLTQPSGTFNDGSGNNNYDNNLNLYWLIQPPGTTNIVLKFDSFETEDGYDFVTVYDGPSTSSPILGKFSGSTISDTLISSGGSMLINFASDAYINYSGWEASYYSQFGNKAFAELKELNLSGITPSLYKIPSNGIGYIYYNFMSNGDSTFFDGTFDIGLIDSSKQIINANCLFLKPGLLRIAIPSSALSLGKMYLFSLPDSVFIANKFYQIHQITSSFAISLYQQSYTRSFDIFAEGSAGISSTIGSLGLGASISVAKFSVKGVGGIGLNIQVDQNNNLTFNRRFDYGIGSSFEVPSVNPVVEDVNAGISGDVTFRTIYGQEISFNGLNISDDQKKMAESGFILETISLGASNLSPLFGALLHAVVSTFNSLSGTNEILNSALIKTYDGLGIEGKINTGFNANFGNIKLKFIDQSISGVISGYNNTFSNSSLLNSNIRSSKNVISAFNYDFSLINFGFQFNDKVSLEDDNFSLFDIGEGMENGAEAFFDGNGQLSKLEMWLKGGAMNAIVGLNYRQTYYNTFVNIPVEYKNILLSNQFGLNGLLDNSKPVSLGNTMIKDLPKVINLVTNNFNSSPVAITTYEDDGKGFITEPQIDIDAALGVGLGLSFGIDIHYYDDIAFPRKYSKIFENNRNYLLYSSNYSDEMSGYNITSFFNDIFQGSAILAKDALTNFLPSLTKAVNNGFQFVLNGINKVGSYIGGIIGNSPLSGIWGITSFSPNSLRIWQKPFSPPIVRNMYYSTRVIHKILVKNKIIFNDANTTLVLVSDNIKVSFIPNGQTKSVDSISSPFLLKMLIDTSKLNSNGFALSDTSRIYIYRYNESNTSWIREGSIHYNDTVEANVYYMANYALGIELTSADDKTPPEIYDYGPKQGSSTNEYPEIYAKIRDNNYGVGVDLTRTYIIANNDTLSLSYDPVNQEVFYQLSSNDNLYGTINVKVITTDYNSNVSSFDFSFNLDVSGIDKYNVINEFKLSQNYPNPFNPITTINYSVKRESDIRIVIYNSIGQYLYTLVNQKQQAGQYSLTFDGSKLASGIYFYYYEAKPLDRSNEYKEAKKMILLK